MNIHLAGIESEVSKGKDYSFTHKNFLVTYEHFSHSKNELTLTKQVNKIKSNFIGCKIILDSGAFSRATKVADFTLDDYMNFLYRFESNFFAYINLDFPLIGEISYQDIIYSKIESNKNLQEMEKNNLFPIPVYQRLWNDFSILESYLEKYDYICIGGILRKFEDKKYNRISMLHFLDKLFNLNSKYNKKIHGLGQTELVILKRYPFYSVDSTSWKRISGVSKIYSLSLLELQSRIMYLDYSTYSKKLLNKNIYDCNGKINYKQRNIYNIGYFNTIQNQLTNLWKYRGIDWEEYDKNKHFTN